MKRFNEIRNKLETPDPYDLEGKTIKRIYPNHTGIYILFEDNSVLAIEFKKEPYDDEVYIEYLDIGDLEDYILLNLGLITQEQLDHARELDRRKREREKKKRKLKEYKKLKKEFEDGKHI